MLWPWIDLQVSVMLATAFVWLYQQETYENKLY